MYASEENETEFNVQADKTKEINITPRSEIIKEQNNAEENKSSNENEQVIQEMKIKSLEKKKLGKIFIRPISAVPKHPIFSSPFVRRLCLHIFGPKKPAWFRTMTSYKLLRFKYILKLVEIGRQSPIDFEEFVEAFQRLDRNISESDIINVVNDIDMDEFEELDFGKFLFLLAYRKTAENADQPKKTSNRHNIILSAIANYILTTSLEDIDRYYLKFSRLKHTALHHHLEQTRLNALSEYQMEQKQIEANEALEPLRALTSSPYARPVPIVPRFRKTKVYTEWKKSKNSLPLIAVDSLLRTKSKPLVPQYVKDKLFEEVTSTILSKDIVSKMNYGRIPLPPLQLPRELIKEMRTGFTVEVKDQILKKVFDSKEEFRTQLKKAAVLYARAGLIPILKHGFPTRKDKNTYIEIYERYLPLREKDMKNYSLWIQPSGYEKI